MQINVNNVESTTNDQILQRRSLNANHPIDNVANDDIDHNTITTTTFFDDMIVEIIFT